MSRVPLCEIQLSLVKTRSRRVLSLEVCRVDSEIICERLLAFSKKEGDCKCGGAGSRHPLHLEGGGVA